MSTAGPWWFCLKHMRVEQGPACANAERLGPYQSRVDAERALETVQERNEEWDRDPRWND